MTYEICKPYKFFIAFYTFYFEAICTINIETKSLKVYIVYPPIINVFYTF